NSDCMLITKDLAHLNKEIVHLSLRPDIDLELSQDVSTVKNEHCTSEIVPVLDRIETVVPREQKTEMTCEMILNMTDK
ncbi:unnamed protein product, partial [Bubo scandiacus]